MATPDKAAQGAQVKADATAAAEAEVAAKEAAAKADALQKAREVIKDAGEVEVTFIATGPGTTRRHGYVPTHASKTIAAADFTSTWMKPASTADGNKVKKLDHARDRLAAFNTDD